MQRAQRLGGAPAAGEQHEPAATGGRHVRAALGERRDEAAVRPRGVGGPARVEVGGRQVGQHRRGLGRAALALGQHLLDDPHGLVGAAGVEQVGRAVARVADDALGELVARRADPLVVQGERLGRVAVRGPAELLRRDGVPPEPGDGVPALHVLERGLDLLGRDLGELHEVADHPLERPVRRAAVLLVEVLGVLVEPAHEPCERQVGALHLPAPHHRVDEGVQRVGAGLVGPLGVDEAHLLLGGQRARRAVGQPADRADLVVGLVQAAGHTSSSSSGWSGSSSVLRGLPAVPTPGSRSPASSSAPRDSFITRASRTRSGSPASSTAET